MNARHRGALIVFAVLGVGRVLDRFDLPFERHPGNGMPPVCTLVPAVPGAPTRPDAPVPGPEADAPPRRPPAALDTARARHPEAGAMPAVVHVNRAAAAELQRLPGVGPVLAARIVDHRRTHGPFRDLTDLCRVKGIGARTAERLASCIRFD